MSNPAYEFTEQEGKRCILARGRTRAGLFTSAMQGIFALMRPGRPAEHAEKVERPFAFEAESPEHLLARMMNEAIVVADTHGETCEEVKFTLITDKKAEGAFTNCGQTTFSSPAVAIHGDKLNISKNDVTGEWEAVICLE
jgi:SHS2 domain-containing protein